MRPLLLTGLVLVVSCAAREETPAPALPAPLIRQAVPRMGTRLEVAACCVSEAKAHEAFALAIAEVDRLDALLSGWRADSQLAAVNAAAGRDSVVVDPELFDVVARSLEVAAQTDGAFDPTFAALWGLWTFGDDGVHTLPDPDAVAVRRALIDYRQVELDPTQHTVFLRREGMRLGLGGIAKGYITDRIGAILREHGVENFVVQAGGELYVSGLRGDRLWHVGIRDPRGTEPFAVIDLTNRAFDTSGDYERYFEVDGRRYHHIIDPATGYPATRSRSATVLAPDAFTADAWSTALFVMGPDGLDRIEALDGLEGVVVDADNDVHVSSGLRERLHQIRPPSE